MAKWVIITSMDSDFTTKLFAGNMFLLAAWESYSRWTNEPKTKKLQSFSWESTDLNWGDWENFSKTPDKEKTTDSKEEKTKKVPDLPTLFRQWDLFYKKYGVEIEKGGFLAKGNLDFDTKDKCGYYNHINQFIVAKEVSEEKPSSDQSKRKIRDYIIEPFANLRGASLRGANLRGADLREADLLGANLLGANLREANLRGASLRGASLRGANLLGANLREADLGGANLREADLEGADLGGANLREADLRGANLLGANLAGADLGGADLAGADLVEANLAGANLAGANLAGADLVEANLAGANFDLGQILKAKNWQMATFNPGIKEKLEELG